MSRLRLAVAASTLAGIGYFSIVAAAQASDPAPAPVFNWSGFYVGAHAGWGSSTTTVNDPFSASALLVGVVGTGDPVRDVNGGSLFGGAQAGFNYQIGRFVVGPELSFSSGIRGSRTDVISGSNIINPNSPFTVRGDAVDARTWGADIDWLAMATGRLGYAWDRWLIYGKGGAAVAAMRYSLRDRTVSGASAAPPAPFAAFETLDTIGTFTGSETRLGWTLGAGVEWALWSGWSVSAEYDYVSFGQRSARVTGATTSVFAQSLSSGSPTVFGPTAGVIDVPVTERLQIVRFSVNYRFSPEPAAVVAKY